MNMNNSKINKKNIDNTKNTFTLTDEQQMVMKSVSVPQQIDVQIKEPQKISQEALQMNESFDYVQKMYQEVLSPQLELNENLKREHKKLLMGRIFKLLKWQFIFTYIYVIILFLGILFSSYLKLSEDIVNNIINFIEFYISSIVVELLSILFFIVKNVFDKSIVDLIKNFDKKK